MKRSCDGAAFWRLAIIAVISLVSCRSSSPDPTPDLETRAVLDWVSPVGATVSPSRHSCTGMTTTDTWDVSAPITWTAYRDRLRSSAPSGYRPREGSEAREVFSRTAGGDAYAVNVDLITSGPPVRVRVSLTAAPY